MGAAIAFYALISLPPVVIVTLQLASLAFDPTIARDTLLSQIQILWGPDATETIDLLAHATMRSYSTSWRAWVAIIASVITASTVFVEMQRSLDVIWGKNSGRTVIRFLKGRLMAFGALVILGFTLWASVLVSTILVTADTSYLDHPGVSTIIIGIINNGITGTLTMMLLVVLYKLLPEHDVTWIDAWAGAIVVTLLFLIGKEIIAYYLGRQTIAHAFGGGIASAIIILLLWFYYSAQIFLYGAELSHEVALERDSHKRQN
jgi:membrane protein